MTEPSTTATDEATTEGTAPGRWADHTEAQLLQAFSDLHKQMGEILGQMRETVASGADPDEAAKSDEALAHAERIKRTKAEIDALRNEIARRKQA